MSAKPKQTQRFTPVLEGWLEAILAVSVHYHLDVSRERLRVSASWSGAGQMRQALHESARQAGLQLRWVRPRLNGITPWRLPSAVELRDGQVGGITAMSEQTLHIVFSGDEGLITTVPAEELEPSLAAVAVMRPIRSAPDERVDQYIKPVERHWLRGIVFAELRPYAHILVASFVANLMALAGILF